MSEILVMVVPGRVDRAFYKRFFRYVAGKLKSEFIDLDSSRYESDKHKILESICKQQQIPGQQESASVLLRGTSVVRLVSTNNNKEINAVIIPSERRVDYTAKLILEYQAGLYEKPSIKFIVVAEDAEEISFEERLKSLYDSLKSSKHIRIDREVSRDKYYRLYILGKPEGVKLMLLVQGLECVDISIKGIKHAIEDYILYLYSDIVDEILNSGFLGETGRDSRSNIRGNIHKKLALMVALKLCYTNIEELLFEGLDDNKLDGLVYVHDGLRVLRDEISKLLADKADAASDHI